jgi:hypothetical protein
MLYGPLTRQDGQYGCTGERPLRSDHDLLYALDVVESAIRGGKYDVLLWVHWIRLRGGAILYYPVSAVRA